ncbi:MAG: N-acetylglucosamine-6-phosphate deacetylase, partial [Tannerellaceae bacterium]|nr:N-acetylglucosamine-6-phosphate deacetylase [Tannerellaceae bacterium]
MENTYTKLINGLVITPTGILRGAQVILNKGIIEEINMRNTEIDHATIIDAQGHYIAPGCIDIHVHGGGGHDFAEANQKAFCAAAQAHALQGGTTAIYPTIAASPRHVFDKAMKTCSALIGTTEQTFGRIMGLHLEGNYLNPLMKGAQDPANIYPPRPAEYWDILRRNRCVRRWSAA